MNKLTDIRLGICLMLFAAALIGSSGCTKEPSAVAPCEGSDCPQPASNACADGCDVGESCVAGKCVCTPQCAGNSCGDDGCGDKCPCDGQTVTDGQGHEVPVEDCKDTCESVGFVCGSVCGLNCGGCAAEQACSGGQCACRPVCDGTSCSDGCGGTCECAAGTVCDARSACVAPEECRDTCETAGASCGDVCGAACGTCAGDQSCVAGGCVEAQNCTDCSLKFYVLDRKVEGGRLRQVTLAIDYAPTEEGPRARVADLRIHANRPVQLVAVEPGAALSEANKALYEDTRTGNTWRQRPDGSFQILAYGISSEPLARGRFATLTFTSDDLGPISFNFVRHLQTLAPAPADAELQSSTFDQAVVVSR